MSNSKSLSGQARRLAAEYRGSPLEAHREVSDVLSKLAAENERLRTALREAVYIAREGCLVPPDGGSPTQAEVDLCDHIAARIAALAQS